MSAPKPDRIALDRASVRTTDADGHLHVASSVISAAAVNEYLGKEIPNAEALALDPARLYKLFRDPAELEKAAQTFHNKPLLVIHKPLSASDHDRKVVVGSVSNPVWDTPNLKAELVVWDGSAIEDIESGEQQDLSAGYRYRAIPEPGEYNGEKYDLRMVDIVANHVALVKDGRVKGAIVGDAALPTPPKETEMAKTALSRKALLASGALTAYLMPKLATDAKVDLRPALVGVTLANWKAKKPGIVIALDAATKGKLAKDATLDDVTGMLDQLDDVVDGMEDKVDAPQADDEAETEEEKAARMAKRATDKAARDAETPEAKAEREKMEAAAAAKEKKEGADKARDALPPAVSPKAMDAAIAAAEQRTVTRMNAIREAEKFVAPWIGEITGPQESAAAVLKLALDSLGVDTAGIHPDAYRPILAAQPKPGEAPKKKTPIALDAKGAQSFDTMFPNATRIRNV